MTEQEIMKPIMVKFLKEKIESSPLAMEAYNLANQGDWDGLVMLYEREEPLWPKPSEPIACKKGCSLCCLLNLDIMDYEKPRLKKAIMALDDHDRQNVFFKASSKNKITKDFNPIEKGNKRFACPMLKNGECSIYEDRPLSCKTFTSVDVNICIEGSEPNSDVQTKQWAQPEIHKQMVELGACLSEIEKGKEIDDLATTLESFIDNEINI